MLITTETEAVKVRFREDGLDKSVRVGHLNDLLLIELQGRGPLKLTLTPSEVKAVAAAATLLEV